MNQNIIEVIEYVTQLKISKLIKENRHLDKKDLVKKIEQVLEEKEEMYKMEDKQIEELLKSKKDNGEI